MPSPQYEWAERQRKAGNCRACGRKRNAYARHCDECQAKVRRSMREYKRRTLGYQPKRPGGPGRPLKED